MRTTSRWRSGSWGTARGAGPRAGGKLGDGAADGLAVERDGDLLVGPLALGGKQRAEGRLLVGAADRPVEADDGALRLTRLLDVGRLEARRGNELFLGRLAPEVGLQLALGLGDLALPDADVRRDANRARAVLDPALDRLADPERRVRGELVALAPVELLGRAHEAEDPLLDEVEQREVVRRVLLRE